MSQASDSLSARLAQLSDLMPIVEEIWQVRDLQLAFWRPEDAEAILDDETLNQPHEALPWQPYWAQAWEACRGMCHHLSSLPLQGLEVLEPGCGLAITAAAALAGGAHVVCGDNAPPALDFAVVNTWPWRDRVEVGLIDWRETRLDRQFDLIVGSDIVYDRREVEPLDRFFRQHLHQAGRVILSDPSRAMTREFLEHFDRLGWHQDVSCVNLEQLRQPTRIVTMQPRVSQHRVAT